MRLPDHRENLDEFEGLHPADYDLEELPGSEARLAFHAALAARSPGGVLELGCGTAIVGLHLAARGHPLTGLDLSATMLAHARAKAQALGLRRTRWVEADMSDFELGRRYGFVFVTGHAFQAMLSDADQDRLFACVRRHLLPGGRFVFDTRNPGGHDLSDIADEEPWHEALDRHGRRVAVGGMQRWDAATQVMHWTTVRRGADADGRPWQRTTRIACRFTGREELLARLRRHGFVVEALYGDWDRRAASATSPELIPVCRPGRE